MFNPCRRTHYYQIDVGFDLKAQAMFTRYQSVAETVPDKVSVHTRNVTFSTFFASE